MILRIVPIWAEFLSVVGKFQPLFYGQNNTVTSSKSFPDGVFADDDFKREIDDIVLFDKCTGISQSGKYLVQVTF